MKQLKELYDRAHGKFIAQSALDFVGATVTDHGSGARAVALHLDRLVQSAKAADNAPIKIMLNGPPGLGKTALALYLQRLLGCDKWSTTKLNGTQMKVEMLDEISRSLHYKGLFGDYRLLHVDEADEWPRVAQVRGLSMIDDLPNGTAIVCTSNCKLKDFENRFQTRFQTFELIPPTTGEIEVLLQGFVDHGNAKQIANFACGNVRQALLDALGVMQQMSGGVATGLQPALAV